MQFHNTLSRSKEEFVPLVPGTARMYCCGPTVYNYAHIGNLRTYIFEDILRRALRFNGFAVTHVMNITDVGHLESDADEGEDKMEAGARREGLDVWELARKYEEAWLADMARLNIERPEVVCRATEHVAEMIALIERLMDRGFGYVTPGAVYFDTSKFPRYSDFARLDLGGLQAGAGGRVQQQDAKRHPNDFVLWFTDRPRHIMQWDSPWGRGYPGWHVECSAMSMKYLGDSFDIHCGGVDHINVHHTNEVAQSECATGHPFARYWLHGEFLNIAKPSDSEAGESVEKMSKSLDNFLTLSLLAKNGYDALAYRYLCLQAHYRSELRFSYDNLEAAQNGLRRVYSARPDADPLTDDSRFADARAEVVAALNDDLNMPQVVGLLNRYGSRRLWIEFDPVLALDIEERSRPADAELPADVREAIAERDAARKRKDWATSDAMRARLLDMGYEVADTPKGTTVKRRPL